MSIYAYYTIHCDGDKLAGYDEEACWLASGSGPRPDYVESLALAEGWIKGVAQDGERHYCPACAQVRFGG